MAELRRCERRPRPRAASLYPSRARGGGAACASPAKQGMRLAFCGLLASRFARACSSRCAAVSVCRVAHAVGGDAARQVGGYIGRAHHSLGGGGVRAAAPTRSCDGAAATWTTGTKAATGRPSLAPPARLRIPPDEVEVVLSGGSNAVKPRSAPLAAWCSCSGSSSTNVAARASRFARHRALRGVPQPPQLRRRRQWLAPASRCRAAAWFVGAARRRR